MVCATRVGPKPLRTEAPSHSTSLLISHLRRIHRAPGSQDFLHGSSVESTCFLAVDFHSFPDGKFAGPDVGDLVDPHQAGGAVASGAGKAPGTSVFGRMGEMPDAVFPQGDGHGGARAALQGSALEADAHLFTWQGGSFRRWNRRIWVRKYVPVWAAARTVWKRSDSRHIFGGL